MESSLIRSSAGLANTRRSQNTCNRPILNEAEEEPEKLEKNKNQHHGGHRIIHGEELKKLEKKKNQHHGGNRIIHGEELEKLEKKKNQHHGGHRIIHGEELEKLEKLEKKTNQHHGGQSSSGQLHYGKTIC